MDKKELFTRACRASCEAVGKDPDELIIDPYGEEFPIRQLRQPRWKWVAEICGKEIKAIIDLTLSAAPGATK